VFLAENHITSAENCFMQALAIDNQDPKSLSGYGMCRMHSKDYNKAYELFLSALSYDPDAIVTILQLLECSYALNKFNDLATVLSNYLESHPNNNDMRFSLAGALYKSGKIQEAKNECIKILTDDPSHQSTLELMPKLKQTSSTVSQSIAPNTLANKPTDSLDMQFENKFSSLEELKRKRKFKDVISGCDEILLNKNLSAENIERSNVLKAEAQALSGDALTAESALLSIINANPKCARALSGLGALAAATQRWNVAKDYFCKAVSANEKCDSALAGLGLCAFYEKNFLEASRLYKQALAINPENTRALLGIIELGYTSKEYIDMENAIINYLDLHPADKSFLFALAGCYYQQNKILEANKVLEDLTTLDPENKDALQLKSMIQNRSSEHNMGLGA
jgi:tetratricopeptide (TPR) repeat protein